MNANGKKIRVETISRTEGGRMKENGGGSEFKYVVLDIL
jgi:hypothetical protein